MRARKAAAVGPSRVIKSSRDCSPPSQKEKRLREEDVDALDGVFSPTLTLGGFMDIDLGSEEDKEREGCLKKKTTILTHLSTLIGTIPALTQPTSFESQTAAYSICSKVSSFAIVASASSIISDGKNICVSVEPIYICSVQNYYVIQV